MSGINKNAPGTTILLMGNEAIARGAIEAGVGVAASYPGNPASEIMDNLAPVAKELGIYAEWSVNEMVALEVAGGASMAGIRAMAAMKQDGVNVVMDYLKANMGGIGKGGMVLISAEDPGSWSSGREEDMRVIAKFFDFPALEPATVQEAKDMMKYIFELSEQCDTLCLLRSSTRISHSRSNVKLGELPKQQRIAYFEEFVDTRNPRISKHLPFPPSVKYARSFENVAKAKKLAEISPFNWYDGPEEPDFLIVTSGSGYLYSKEAVQALRIGDRTGILKLGTVWPLPEKLLRKYVSIVPQVLVAEEVSPFFEEHIKKLLYDYRKDGPHPAVYGKQTGHLTSWGELTPNTIMKAISRIVDIPYPTRNTDYIKMVESTKKDLPVRATAFCPGCPHRASFWAMKNALKLDGRNGFVTGDIGCYFTAFSPTGFSQIRTGHCMGAGIGVANGFGKLEQFGFNQPVLATCGDSTFFHAGIPGLINSVWNRSNFVTVILDNSATAMTGFQPHPGVGITAMGEVVKPVSIEAICRSIGMRVETCDPFDLQQTVSLLLDMMNDKESGGRVVILKRECELIRARHEKPPYKMHVDIARCVGESCGCDKLCNRIFGCSGLIWDKQAGKARIDDVICAGCGLCASICHQEAIIKEANL